MSNQILYGVGKAVLREFTDLNTIIALADLKNLEVNTSGDEEKIYGGDSLYPLASFPKEKSITITAENATFDFSMLEATQGGTATKSTSVTFTEIEKVRIPEDGTVTVKQTPNSNSVVVEGFTEGSTTPSTGEYVVDTVEPKVEFDSSDAGTVVNIVYEWDATNADLLEVFKDSTSKTFKFVYRIPIYDDNSSVSAYGQLTVFKAKANNSFTFGMQPQTAFAPRLELEAVDPQRDDGKLWEFAIAPVE